MPLSSVLGASSVIKPGVCTSTTRPSVPYTGQLIYETDTKRLAAWNGAAWIYETAADGPPGLVLVKSETAFTSASSITADNVFTSSYTNYTVRIEGLASSAQVIGFKLRTGGSSASTNYNYQLSQFNSTSITGSRSSSQSSGEFGSMAVVKSTAVLNLFNPQLAVATIYDSFSSYVTGGVLTGPVSYYYTGNHSTATAYDGIEIIIGGGATATGTYAIYAWSKQ